MPLDATAKQLLFGRTPTVVNSTRPNKKTIGVIINVPLNPHDLVVAVDNLIKAGQLTKEEAVEILYEFVDVFNKKIAELEGR